MSGDPEDSPVAMDPDPEALAATALAMIRNEFEALFAGLDWRKVKALEARPPAAAE